MNEQQTERGNRKAGGNFSSRWLGRLRAWHAATDAFLAEWYELHNQTQVDPGRGGPRTLWLRRGELLRLTRISQTKQIEVRRGTVWLTGTPSVGDVVLRSGDRFEMTNHWPFVLEPLADVEICLSN